MIVTTDLLKNILANLESEREILYEQIDNRAIYIASTTEDPSSVKPEFNLKEVTNQITALNDKIIKLKHFRNIHNSKHIVGNTGMTADELLIQVGMLSKSISAYAKLINREVKSRRNTIHNSQNIIEYEYTNYDPTEAKSIYDSLILKRNILYMELDKFNALDEFEIPD